MVGDAHATGNKPRPVPVRFDPGRNFALANRAWPANQMGVVLQQQTTTHGKSQMVTVELLSDLARRAGAITLQHYQSGLDIETKADESPVTIADRQTEQFLRAEIARLFPGDGIVGEEFGATEGTTGRKWIVDPIDGTKSFIHGVPFYGVMIGVEQDGAMLAGAVYIPPLGEMVVAVKGAGCWWNGKRARVTATERIEDALLLTTDIAHHYQHGRCASWEALSRRARLVRTWGDCYGYVLVATGRADIMLDAIMSPWDMAALQTILEEAGGAFSDYEGKVSIYSNSAIGSNGILHAEVLRVARELASGE
jgi:histidinol phosphatase-like enzyme (inositol monophosphatase family)